MQQKKINKRIKSFDGVVRRDFVKEIQKEIKVTSTSQLSYKEIFLSGLKMSGVGFLVVLFFIGLGKTGNTVSYYNNVEKSQNNKLQAGVLSLNISEVIDTSSRLLSFASTDEVPTEKVVEETAVGSLQFGVSVTEDEGSLPIAYKVIGKLNAENPSGCEEINILASLGSYSYDGLVNVFVSPVIADLGEWQFLASLPISSSIFAPNAICEGSIIFRAGILGTDGSMSETYSDVKIYSFKLQNWESVASFSIFSVPPEETLPTEGEAKPFAPEVFEDIPSDPIVVVVPEEIVPELEVIFPTTQVITE